MVWSGESSKQWIYIEEKSPSFVLIRTASNALLVEVKWIDDTYVFDQSVGEKGTLLIPSYRPIEWIYFSSIKEKAVVSVASFRLNVTSNGIVILPTECKEMLEGIGNISMIKHPRSIKKPVYQFFLTAEIVPDVTSVSLTTVFTIDRVKRLAKMSEMWGGPISAVLYISDFESDVSRLMTTWMDSIHMRLHVDVHLAWDDRMGIQEWPSVDYALPINFLRTVSVKYCRTDRLMYIESDFVPSLGLREFLDSLPQIRNMNDHTAYIVNSFMTEDEAYIEDFEDFPRDKLELNRFPTIKPIEKFGDRFNQIEYTPWIQAKKPWQISQVHADIFEPYYVVKRNVPPYDEVFLGCGRDKVSHVRELAEAGYAFYALHDGFIVHLPHTNETKHRVYWCGESNARRWTLKWEMMTQRQEKWYRRRMRPKPDSTWWNSSNIVGNTTLDSGDPRPLPTRIIEYISNSTCYTKENATCNCTKCPIVIQKTEPRSRSKQKMGMPEQAGKELNAMRQMMRLMVGNYTTLLRESWLKEERIYSLKKRLIEVETNYVQVLELIEMVTITMLVISVVILSWWCRAVMKGNRY